MSPVAKHPQHGTAIAMLLLANLFWGLSFPVIKSLTLLHEQLLPGSETWFITACVLAPRFTLATLVLAILCFGALRTLTRNELRQGLELGLFAIAGMMFQSDGLQFTSASTSAFLTQLYAILIPIWLALRCRRSPSRVVWMSCTFVLVGGAVLARLDWRDLHLGRGELQTLIASVFFMGQILCLDRREFANNRALPVTTVMFGVNAIVALAIAGFTAPADANVLALGSSAPWIALTLMLTLFCTLGTFTIMNAWQPKITATEAGLIYCAEPVFASLMALFLPAWFSLWGAFHYANETATPHLLIGGGLITAANILIQLNPPPKPPEAVSL